MQRRSTVKRHQTAASRPVDREGIESFLVALGLFLAALVWFWITCARG